METSNIGQAWVEQREDGRCDRTRLVAPSYSYSLNSDEICVLASATIPAEIHKSVGITATSFGIELSFKVRERYDAALKLQKVDQVPVAYFAGAMFIVGFAGLGFDEYHKNVRNMLNAQLKVWNRFPKAIMFPGVYPDYGTNIAEASALGGPIRWSNTVPPQTVEFIKRPEQIEELEVPDPHKDGLMPQILHDFDYFIREAPKSVKVEFGWVRGPLQVSAAVRGLTELMKDLVLRTELAHKLIDVATRTAIEYLRAQQEIAGQLERVFLSDDVAGGLLSPSQFREFAAPYFKKIYETFPDALHMYHSDSNSTRILEDVAATGVQAFNFGPQVRLEEVKQRIGSQVCLIGGLGPLRVWDQPPESVQRMSRECIERAAHGYGYVLCTGGGLPKGTPPENVDTVIEAAEKYGKYPI